MLIGTIHFDLDIPEAFNRKDKRRVVNSLKERLSNRFPISVAEVGSLDIHNRAEIGVAMVSGDGDHLREVLEAVVRFVQNDLRAFVIDFEIEID